MATRAVRLPDVGEGIAEAEVIRWLVAVGDHVAEGDPIAEVMTDKATVELPSPATGVLSWHAGEAGTVVAVGAPLFELDGAAEPEPEPASPVRADGPTLAAPAVRRRAKELGVSLDEVAGTGEEGRVRQRDLDRFADAGRTRRVPVTGLRRSIARHMDAASRVPHFTYVEEVDVTELARTRAAFDAEARRTGRDVHFGWLPFFMRAVVLAVGDHEEMNARYLSDEGVLEVHDAVHLGMAVQTDDGLVVVVLRDAQDLDLIGLGSELERLAERARSASATPEELRGSTVTISSLGPLGGVAATPIVNHPEVAIVGLNRIEERAVVRDGAVVVRTCMNVSASFDHRIVDGWDAARFVQRIRTLLETPALLFA